ncbi:hypothetical protein BH09SUM1_BH09SUM1_29180 [soil metagenome]
MSANASERRLHGALIALLCAIFAIQFFAAARMNLWADDIAILLDARLRTEGIAYDFFVQGNGFWRPGTRLLFRFANALWGMAPLYSVLSVALHGLNVWLLWKVAQAKKLFAMEPVPAAVAALLFAAGFAWSEAVFMLSASGDKLLVSAILAGLVWGGTPLRDLLFAALCVFAKDNGFIYPLIALARELLLNGTPVKKCATRLWPAFALAGAYFVWFAIRLSHVPPDMELGTNDRTHIGPNAIKLAIDQWSAFFLYGPFDTNALGLFYIRPIQPLRWAIRLLVFSFAAGAIWAARNSDDRRHVLFIFAWLGLIFGTTSMRTGTVVGRYLYDAAPCWALFVPLASGFMMRGLSQCACRVVPATLLCAWFAIQAADWTMSPAIVYDTTVPKYVRMQMEALAPALEEAALPPGSTAILSRTAFAEDEPRHEKLIQAYVGMMYPAALLDVRIDETVSQEEEARLTKRGPLARFKWSAATESWNVTKPVQ